MASNVYIPESAMAIVAHPDDIEFGSAGTLARWAKAGSRISYVLCTSGDVGIAEPGMTRARAVEIREAEAREAARIAGATEIIFLREPDGMLQATLELRKNWFARFAASAQKLSLPVTQPSFWQGPITSTTPITGRLLWQPWRQPSRLPVSLTCLKNWQRKA